VSEPSELIRHEYKSRVEHFLDLIILCCVRLETALACSHVLAGRVASCHDLSTSTFPRVSEICKLSTPFFNVWNWNEDETTVSHLSPELELGQGSSNRGYTMISLRVWGYAFMPILLSRNSKNFQVLIIIICIITIICIIITIII
jgi:hypothetical protein